jgi:hypothetical protein
MKPLLRAAIAVVITLLAAAAPGQTTNLTLYEFQPKFSRAGIGATDATIAMGVWDPNPKVPFIQTCLRVTTGHQQPWPGITLPAPNGSWNLSPFEHVAVRLRNAGTNQLTVFCRVDNPGADGTKNCVTGSLSLDPGKSGTLRAYLARAGDDKMGGKLFGLRGYPVKAGGPGTVDPARVTQLLIFVSQPKQDHVFDIASIEAGGEYVPPTAWTSDADPYFPLIDALGQYRHKDWPGKTKAVADLAKNRAAEERDLAANPGPANWDQYGGNARGPKLQATGFFRTEKYQGKWWLVDPEGRLFFSHGIDCVRMLDATPIEERESWFEDFPGAQPDFRAFLSTGYALKGRYAGRSVKCFSFAGANLQRKYGPAWRAVSAELIHRRLRSWGINTIANWSDMGLAQLRRTPYTDTFGTGRAKNIEGSEGYWGKFPDVFDASFTEAARRGMAGKKGGSAGDPWCIGYFSDNEMSWGDEYSLALAALKSPPEQAAKKVLAAGLQAKYGEIAKLNQAWGTGHQSWEALLQSRNAPDRAKAREDLVAFYRKAAEQYFRTIREAVKEVAPQQLYLGCRFAWANSVAASAAAKYCDVVSYNLYQRTVAEFKFDGGTDKPLIIGEFHFGALDRGMFHTGLVPTASQKARAQAYRDYVLGALKHPAFVGCHWFQYQDEPTTGRVYDEENYQIGFVDIADTPYAEIIAASRAVGKQLYLP